MSNKFMKAFTFAIVFLLLISILVGCQNTSQENSAVSDIEESEQVSSISETSEQENKVVKSDMVYNVKDFGAKANGADDSASIQAAIDKCASSGGGTVFFPAGTYSLKSTIVKKAKVSLVGSGMYATYLSWIGSPNSAMIDTANHALWGTSIENMFFSTANVQKVTGILGGSTLQNYNSAIGTFKNLVFSGLYCGISGNAEPTGVGIFDCNFENIFASACTYGLHLYGSGNTIVHPRLATCEVGIVLDYLNGESFDGIHVIGGIFASNKTDILVPAKSGTRPCNFVGTWFEDASEGIITIKNTDTRIMNMTFRDCMLNSKADGKNFFMFDASKALGVITLDSCTVVNNAGIIEPENPSSKLVVKNLQVYDSDRSYIINDSAHGKFSAKGDGTKKSYVVTHNSGFVPSFANVTIASSDLANNSFYITADEKTITVNFSEAPKQNADVAFYWEVRK